MPIKQNKIPTRRCIGCMESKPKKDLIRIVVFEEDSVRIDLSGKANGRGAYLCPNPECIEKAKKKKAFARNLSISVTDNDIKQIENEIAEIINKNTQRTNR